MEKEERSMGWEVAREVEREKPTILERLKPEKGQIKTALCGVGAVFIVFLVACWLAGNPFEATQRIPSDVVKARGWVGTDNWTIFWYVIAIAVFFEFMDASAGMGCGTALVPLLLVLGFDPKQIVPAVMIQQGIQGLVGAFLHREYGNVEWKLKPMTETVRLWPWPFPLQQSMPISMWQKYG